MIKQYTCYVQWSEVWMKKIKPKNNKIKLMGDKKGISKNEVINQMEQANVTEVLRKTDIVLKDRTKFITKREKISY